MFLTKKWGILIKKESESLIFTGLKIPRDYYRKRGVSFDTTVKNMGVIIGNNTEQLQKAVELMEDIKDELERRK